MSNNVSVWYDAEAHNGRGTPTEYNESADILPVIPVDPCVTCEMAASCAANMTDCKAFRTYAATRSEEHTSELQSQSTTSNAVFCLQKKKKTKNKKKKKKPQQRCCIS